MNNIKKIINLENEVIDNNIEEILEENLTIDNNLIQNGSLIRVDMNIVQYPLFSKNTRRKINQAVKYYFNGNRDTYIKVSPIAGDHIPGDFDEKVFIAISKIIKKRGFSRNFTVTSSDIKRELGNEKDYIYKNIRQSIKRLSSTNYIFKNTMYSSEIKGVIDREISTNILTVEIIDLKLDSNKKFREEYQDLRVKEIYKFSINDHFYNNIVSKGYLVYDSDVLLQIPTSTARTLYMLIEKLRFDKSKLEVDIVFLIKRIPLKFDKKNLSRTIKTLKDNLEELKKMELIKNYEVKKENTWENSNLIIEFSNKVVENKQLRFFEDKNEFRKISTSLTISNTENTVIEENAILKNVEIKKEVMKVTLGMVNDIIKIMPSKAKTLKSLPKTIEEAIYQYGLERVQVVAKYMKKNKVEKIRAYFLKALKEEWEIEVEERVEINQEPTLKEEDVLMYNENLFEKFEKLETNIKDGIEAYVYREYINKCGMEGKIQQLAFSASRKKHICEFLEKHPEIVEEEKEIKKTTLEEVKQVDNEQIENIEEIKQIINEAVELADMAFSYSEEEKKKLILKILKDVIPLKTSKQLTIEKLNQIIANYMDM
ncbi:replication initiation protein [Cetobacterium somerae]